MQPKPLPREDQLVTMVSVREGNIYVTSANALVVKESTIALRIDASLNPPPEFQRAQPVTILYTGGDRVLRLKAVVRERIDEMRLTVEPVGDVKEGDRRDYRRVDMEAGLQVRPITESDADARTALLAAEPNEDALPTQSVNISGSGLQWHASEGMEDATFVLLHIRLEGDGGGSIPAIGQIVRCVPSDDGHLTAVRFVDISEAAQDRIVHAVFAKFFQSDAARDLTDLDSP